MKVPFVPRLLELCHDIEPNPGPRTTSSSSSNYSFKTNGNTNANATVALGKANNSTNANSIHKADSDVKMDRLERELENLQTLLRTLDDSVMDLKDSIDNMKPAYHQALQMLAKSDLLPAPGQKNNLVFHGVVPDELEIQMESEPEFCRDVLETRIKMVFREFLRISRDMPLTHIYRLDVPVEMANEASKKDLPRPLVVGFKSLKDKDNILRHSNLLKREGIFVTEDCTFKKAVTLMAKSPKKMPSQKTSKASGSTSVNTTSSTKTKKSSNPVSSRSEDPNILAESSAILSDHLSSCNSDYAPSSHSGNSSSSVYTD